MPTCFSRFPGIRRRMNSAAGMRRPACGKPPQKGVKHVPFWRTYYHVVWATKNREPMINPEIEPRLYAYIVNKAAELGVFIYEINGWMDHVHIVAAIPPHVSVSEAVKQIKGASSHDLNQQGLGFYFAWLRGYGVLTLGQRQKSDAEAYIRSQKDHHRQQSAIPWLERYAEIGEGPPDAVIGAGQPVPAVREVQVSYDSLGEAAF